MQAEGRHTFCLGPVAVEGGVPETRTNSKATITEARCVLGPGPNALGIFSWKNHKGLLARQEPGTGKQSGSLGSRSHSRDSFSHLPGHNPEPVILKGSAALTHDTPAPTEAPLSLHIGGLGCDGTEGKLDSETPFHLMKRQTSPETGAVRSGHRKCAMSLQKSIFYQLLL